MSTAYWSQWSHSEIMSMHGVELKHDHADDQDDYEIDNNHILDDDCCPRCQGEGCNRCLMLE